ncbi:hypothetical protein PIROE2DRAFT_14968 [Piromyces sp. E2]|nr:hypothetical protein PIROE2DRAFT_14968 [Piromyces sp. E2]|eukprot:OUM59490.1 hypothetical protein PIROE2DRAFT_14968 [Piromyces sp. E2]
MGNYSCEIETKFKNAISCALVDCSIAGGYTIPSCQFVTKCNCCLRMYDHDHDYFNRSISTMKSKFLSGCARIGAEVIRDLIALKAFKTLDVIMNSTFFLSGNRPDENSRNFKDPYKFLQRKFYD